MRRWLKFLHTTGAAGYLGGMASLLVLMLAARPPAEPASYVLMYRAMAAIASFVLFPSLALTMIAGLLALAWNRAFHDAGWAWAKFASGVLVFEGGLVGIQGPIHDEAQRSAAALASHADAAAVIGAYGAEQGPIWVLLAVGLANCVLGVWRPRFTRVPQPPPPT